MIAAGEENAADDPGWRRYREPDPGPEIALPSGDVTEGVVRVGATVRRPAQPTSLAVAHYLDHLQRVGFEAAPRFLGRDEVGRDVLTFIEGDVATSPPQRWAADEALLAEVGQLIRRLHEASTGHGAPTGFAAPDGSVWRRDMVTVDVPLPEWRPELISHNDITPQNVVFHNGRAVGLIDFDLAGPTTRLRELVNTAVHWVPLVAPQDVPPTWHGVDQAARWRMLVDAYGLDTASRSQLVDLAITAAQGSWLRMRAAAEQLGGGWARMWEHGVGEVIRRRQEWLTSSRTSLNEALLQPHR